MDKIYKYIIGFGVITLVSIVLSFIALFKRGPTGAKGDSGDKGDIGASGKGGIQGPPGPAGIMTVQCSSDSGNGTSCKAKIPNELVVDGLTVENTLQVGTSTAYRWNNDGIQLGSPDNSWSQSGDLTTSGDIKTSGDLTTSGDIKTSGKLTANGVISQSCSPDSPSCYASFGHQVIIEGRDGLVLNQGSISVDNGYITVGPAAARASVATLVGDISTSGNLTVGSPDNSSSQSGNIGASNNIIANGSVRSTKTFFVGSDDDANTWSPAGAIASGPSGNVVFKGNVAAVGSVRGEKGLYVGQQGAGGVDGNKWETNGKITAAAAIEGYNLVLNTTAAGAVQRKSDMSAAIWLPNISDDGKQVISTKWAGMNANLDRST